MRVIDRYDAFARFLCENGIAAIGHDHLGHGLSARSPEDLGVFAEERAERSLIDDMYAVTLEARQEFPGAPNFILGHSMGSFFVRRYLTRYGGYVSGAIIMGTGWIPNPVPGLGKAAANLVCAVRGVRHRSPLLTGMALGASEKAFAAEGKLAWLSVNRENVKRYEADPLCGFMFSAGAYRDFFGILADLAAEKDFDAMPRSLPLLVVSGAEDPVGGRNAVEKLAARYRELGFERVTDRVYPGDRHEILNETNREAVYNDLLAWLRAAREPA